jgi:hypothetical protein
MIPGATIFVFGHANKSPGTQPPPKATYFGLEVSRHDFLHKFRFVVNPEASAMTLPTDNVLIAFPFGIF